MNGTSLSVAIVALLMTSPLAAQDDKNWDGLTRVKSHHLDAVYLMPQADFGEYAKVMLDPTEVAFRKNWQRDSSDPFQGGRVSDADARKILEAAREEFEKLFAAAYTKAGYEVVMVPGPDVLRVETAVINLDIEAPDSHAAGRVRTYSREAGSATLVVEARDSLSGALLGRAVDAQAAGDFGPYLRNSVTNRADFQNLFARWAKQAAEGLTELKALSPVSAGTVGDKR